MSEDQKHGVSIRFSAEGADVTGKGASTVAAGLGEVEKKGKDAKKSLGDLKDQTGDLVASFVRFFAIAGGAAGLTALVNRGLEYNKVLEDTKVGIGAVLLSNQQITDSTGKLVTTQQALTFTMGQAADVQKKLQVDALSTAASYKELTQAFQTTVGPAFAAGVSNIDKVRQITVAASQAMSALGIPARQASQEIRAMFTGEQGPDNQLNMQLRITKAQIEAVRRSGQDLGDFYLKKLAPFATAAAVAQQSLSVQLSNLGDVLDQVLGAASKPLFEAMKAQISGVSGTITSFRDKLSEIGQTAGQVVTEFAPLVQSMVGLGVAAVSAGTQFVHEMAPIVPVITQILGVVSTLVAKFGDMGIAIFVGVKAFGALANIIGPLPLLFAKAGEAAASFNAILLANPYILIAAGLAVLAGAAAVAANKLLLMHEEAQADAAWKRADDQMAVVQQRIAHLTGQHITLADTAKITTLTLKEQNEVFKLMAENMKTAEGPFQTIAQLIERVQTALHADPNPVPPDAKAMEKWKDELAKTIGHIKELSNPGLVGQMIAVQNKIAQEVTKLKREQAAAPSKEEKGIIGSVIAAKEREGAIELKKIADHAWTSYLDVQSKAHIQALHEQLQFQVDEEKLAHDHAVAAKVFEENIAKELAASDTNTNAGRLTAQRAAHAKTIADLKAQLAASGGVVEEGRARINEVEKRFAREDELEDRRMRDIKTGNWAALWADLNAITSDSVSALRDRIRTVSDAMLDSVAASKDYATGVAAGTLQILNSIPTQAESAAAAVNSVWSSMADTFETGFFDVISLRFDDLSNVFKNFADSILHSMSKMVTGMVERWVKGLLEMSEQKRLAKLGEEGSDRAIMGGNVGGGFSGGTVAGAALAAGAGFYGGYAGASENRVAAGISGAGGALIGVGAGMAATGVGVLPGLIVAAIGAILLLVGTLVKTNTEMHVTGSFLNMLGGSTRTWIKGTGRGPRGEEGEEFTPGHWENIPNKVSNSAEEAGKGVLDSLQASLTDIFRLAAPDQASAMTESYRSILKSVFANARFDVAAGSADDIQKNINLLFQSVMPKLALQAGFGQIGYGPNGNRDNPGGIAGIDFGNLPGMDREGNYIQHQLFDPDAPIPKMLAGLGITSDKIKEVATRLTTDDPTKFLAYLQSLVSVAVGFRDLGTEMSKTREDLYKEFAATAASNPADSFVKPAAVLTDLFKSLSLYSGDEQLKKAGEAIAAANQFWDQMKSAAQQVWALGKQLSDGIQAQRAAMRDTLAELLHPGSAVANAQGVVEGVWGKIDAAKNSPSAIASATKEAQDAIQFLFGTLIDLIKQAQSVAANIEQSIGGQRASMRDTLFSLLNPSGAHDLARESVDGVWGALGAAGKDPAKIASAVQAAQAGIQFLFDELISQIKEAQSTLADNRALAGLLRSSGDAPTGPRTIVTGFTEAAGFRMKIDAAAKLSGQTQVNAIKDVQAAARDMYSAQIAMIRQIDANAQDLTGSIAKQKFSMFFDSLVKKVTDENGNVTYAADEQAQGQNVLDRIKSLMGQISGTVDPTQVKDLTDEIQGLVAQYFQMLPMQNREAARGILDQILDETKRLANESYARMREQLVTANQHVAEILDQAATILEGNITEASTAVGQLTRTLHDIDVMAQGLLGGIISDSASAVGRLTFTLNALDGVVQTKLAGIVEGILAAGQALRDEMEKQRIAFSGGTAGAGRSTGAVGGAEETTQSGLTAAVDRSSAALDRQVAAADRLGAALDRITARISADGSLQRGSSSTASANVTDVISTVLAIQRRVPQATASMLGR